MFTVCMDYYGNFIFNSSVLLGFGSLTVLTHITFSDDLKFIIFLGILGKPDCRMLMSVPENIQLFSFVNNITCN